MYFPTTRVLTVLEMLRSRGQMSGPEIAERLEVDPRTVRRYITMLQDLGIPVEALRGRYGTYQLRPGYRLPPLMFSDTEALSLTLGLLIVRKMGLSAQSPTIESALAKIEHGLPEVLRQQVQAVQDSLILDFAPARTTVALDVVMNLSAATQQRHSARITHRAYTADAFTERVIDPYGLVLRSGFWYVVGFCHLRSDLRTFRLDRIEQALLCDETFERPEDFDCLGYVWRSISQMPSTWFAEVLLETTLDNAHSCVSPALAVLEPVPEGVMFRCYTENLDWLARVLAGFHFSWVVYQPQELRDAITALSQRLAVRAQRIPDAQYGSKQQ